MADMETLVDKVVEYVHWLSIYFESLMHDHVLHSDYLSIILSILFEYNSDRSTEWLNAIGRKSGGLVGITRVASTLSRWTLSYTLRTVIASHTTAMLRLTTDDEDDEYTHNECTKGRMEKDDIDEGNIVVSLKRHGVFQYGGDTLENLINNVVVTPEIQESLLSAEHIRQAQMKVFADKRLSEPPDSDHHLNLKAPIHKNKANTCILHCIHSHVETIVVAVQDTYVLLLLLAHYDRTECTRLYMKAGM